MKSSISALLGLLVLGWMAPLSGQLQTQQGQDYRIVHCLMGCPVGAGAGNHLLLRPIYALSYNPQRKSADWAAYQVTADTVGVASSLSREPLPDEFVTDTLTASDFLALEESGLVRGQYVPLVNFAGTPYWNDVNYLTNAVPRSSRLNQGAWNGLEWAIRNLVNREQALYVITGPLFDDGFSSNDDNSGGGDKSTRLTTDYRIPGGFFKIVATAEGNTAAFVFRQDTSVGVHHCELQASIDSIERLSGLSFFPERHLSLQDSLALELGC